VLRIASVAAPTPWVLAPMAGITDSPFRRHLRRLGGVGIVTMEFVSADGIVRGDARALGKMRFTDVERPLSMQIYGSDPARIAEAARVVEAEGADLCDINMGCPANTILRGCAGARLMGDLAVARRIVAECRRAIALPLTVKFRSGLTEEHLADVELGRICEGEGADAVALHPRTARQMFRGRADWDRIGLLKAALSIPVIGNGDVETAADAVRMLEQTGCDGVMIGRASMTNPWIYRQADALLRGLPLEPPTLEERRDRILEHFAAIVACETPRNAIHKLRTFTGWYSRGLPEGRALRVRISHLDTPEAFVDAVTSHFRWFSAVA